FSLLGEVGLVGAFGLHQVAGASVGFEAGIDGEHDAFAGVGTERLDHALGHAGPVDLFGGVTVGDDEVDVGVAAQVELAHAEAAEAGDLHLIVAQITGAAAPRPEVVLLRAGTARRFPPTTPGSAATGRRSGRCSRRYPAHRRARLSGAAANRGRPPVFPERVRRPAA